jgi:hypothetical protein
VAQTLGPASPAAVTNAPALPASGGAGPAAAFASTAGAGVVAPADMPGGSFTTFLSGLSPAERMAHRALATLRNEFTTAGWSDEPFAVAVYHRLTGDPGGTVRLVAVYATADGVSMWPVLVRLPRDVVPLMRVPGLDPKKAAARSGNTDVRAKLEWLVPEEYGTDRVLLTSEGQDSWQYHQIIEAKEQLPVSKSRPSYARTNPEKATSAVTTAMLSMGLSDKDIPIVSNAMWAMTDARWSGPIKPGDYDDLVAAYLISEAKVCLADKKLAEAGFSIGEVIAGLD